MPELEIDADGLVIPPDINDPKPEPKPDKPAKPAKAVVEPKKAAVVEGDDDWDAKFKSLADDAKKAQDRAAVDAEARKASEQKAAELQGKLSAEVETRVRAQEEIAAQGLAGTTEEIKAVKAAIQVAYEEGRGADIADLTDRLTEAKIKLREYTNYQGQIAHARKQLEEQAKAPPDPLANIPQSAKDWITAHPEFMSDETYNRKVRAYAEIAVAEGHAPFSKGYFDYVETQMGLKTVGDGHENDGDEGGLVIDQPQPRRQAPPSDIPVRRQQVGGRPRNDGKIRLTEDEREMADISMGNNVTDEKRIENYRKYAAERDRLKAAGEL